jgi:hypothetical protein
LKILFYGCNVNLSYTGTVMQQIAYYCIDFLPSGIGVDDLYVFVKTLDKEDKNGHSKER